MRYIKKIAVTSMETTGRILDSMNPESGNPFLNAPSINAVKRFLSSKIINSMSSEDDAHEAPSIRAVNDALSQINSDVNHYSGDEASSTLTRKNVLTVGLERGLYLMAVRVRWSSVVYYQEPTIGTFRKLYIGKNTSPFEELGSAPALDENAMTSNSATFILNLSDDSTFTFETYHDNSHSVTCWVEVDTLRLK